MRVITHSPEESIVLAKKIGERLHVGDVIAYHGDLGAGKTTFTRGLCLGLGLPDMVTSPTFALVHVYGEPPKQLCHFDMYRITNTAELETTGFYDYDRTESILVIEWSENIETALPSETLHITIERIDEETRTITIEGSDRFEDLST